MEVKKTARKIHCLSKSRWFVNFVLLCLEFSGFICKCCSNEDKPIIRSTWDKLLRDDVGEFSNKIPTFRTPIKNERHSPLSNYSEKYPTFSFLHYVCFFGSHTYVSQGIFFGARLWWMHLVLLRYCRLLSFKRFGRIAPI